MPTPTIWQSAQQNNTGAIDGNLVGHSQVVALSNGNFLVAWRDEGSAISPAFGDADIHGRLYNAAGQAISQTFQLNTEETSGEQREFDIVDLRSINLGYYRLF